LRLLNCVISAAVGDQMAAFLRLLCLRRTAYKRPFMTVRRPTGRFLIPVSVAAFASVLASCAAINLETAATEPPRADCVDDSPACVERRGAALKEMLADPKRGWVREPANAHSYAAGVRLFAFRSRKRDLTCEELAHGKREADG